MGDYLLKRIDRPLAYVLVFGCGTMAALAAVGYGEGGARGSIEAGIAGLIAGSLIGLLFGCAMWLTLRLVADRPVRRPDYWALNLRCTSCEYHTTPEGPWRIRDCIVWPEQCPCCGGSLVMVVPTCPECGAGGLAGESVVRDFLSQMRWPRSFSQAIYGGFTCEVCSCNYDKWGREKPA